MDDATLRVQGEGDDMGSADDMPSMRHDTPDLDTLYRRELREGATPPTSAQVAAALAAAALVSPAALGGMPVLPVTLDDERRRQQEEIAAESSSSVGAYQDVCEAATALTLSQRRLAAVTREVEGTHTRNVTEADVVDAAHKVAAGEVSPRKRQEFRAALGRVAVDSVDLFILLDDDRRERERAEALQTAAADDEDPWDWDDDPWDDDDSWDEDSGTLA